VAPRPFQDAFVARKSLRATGERDVCFAERRSDGRLVVLKTFRPNTGRARKEFEATRALEHPRIARALDLIEDDTSATLILERAPGITLREWVTTELPELRSTLEVALCVSEALSHIHERRFAHGDVSPDNVVVDPSTLDCVVVDLGLTKPLGARAALEPSRETGPEPIASLAYIAPEQTGRMNRGWDFRSDLYNFGATLYFLLTGHPPFQGTDPLELVHAHIARAPLDPRELSPAIAGPVARMVLCLLQKEPEDRYASASLVRQDLLLLAQQLERDGEISDSCVLPGMQASRHRLRFPNRNYGRELEQQRLEDAFDRAASGARVALLIEGEAGIGKSALLEALRLRVVERGGHLVSGQFDEQAGAPFAAWTEALESLGQQLLLLPDAELEALRSTLSERLGDIARALVELAPEMAFILPATPEMPALAPRATRERMALALERALGVLATRAHPVVIALDDLHHADPGSLELARALLCQQTEPAALLFLGLHRSSTPTPNTALEVWKDQIRERSNSLEHLRLAPLEDAASLEWLSDTFACTKSRVRSLASELSRKLGNRPFLMRAFLENLYSQGLLQFDGERWDWDDDAIGSARIPEQAVDLMLARIGTLGRAETTLLCFAACIGDPFVPSALTELGAGDANEVEQTLVELCAAGFIVPARVGFRFAHDRIREAALTSFETTEREQLHYAAGCFLLSQTPDHALAARATAIADQLNQAAGHIQPDQRLKLASINLLAGQAASNSGALEAATGYLEVGFGLLREADWEAEHELAYKIGLASADGLFQCGRYAECVERLDQLEQRPLELPEWIYLESKRLLVFAVTRPPDAVAERVVRAFRKVGVRWSLPVSRFRFWRELRAGRRELESCRYGLDWKPTARFDPLLHARTALSLSGAGIASRADSRLSSLICYLSARTNTRRGFLRNPGYSLASCAFSEIADGQDPVRAARYAESAQAWTGVDTDPVFTLRQEFLLNALVYPWLRSRHEVLPPLSVVSNRARELGDPEFAYYTEINQGVYLALGGDRVSTSQQRFTRIAEGVHSRGQRYPEAALCQRLYEVLSVPQDLAAAVAERVAALEASTENVPPSGIVYYRTLCMQVLCIAGHYDLALAQSEQVREYLFRVVPFLHVADHTFYRGLAAAALARKASRRQRRAHLRTLRECLRRFTRWADWGPDFGHMRSFLLAELAALRSELRTATTNYDSAARGAEAQGFIHHAALAIEHKGRLLASQRRREESAACFAAARKLYGQWGCAAKVPALPDGDRR